MLKDATPDIREIDSDIWINQFSGSRKVIAYQGSGEEIGCMILGNKPGGLLVKKIMWIPTPEQPIVYIQVEFFDEIICSDIPLTANDIIDKYELTGLCVFHIPMNDYICVLYIIKV